MRSRTAINRGQYDQSWLTAPNDKRISGNVELIADVIPLLVLVSPPKRLYLSLGYRDLA